MFKALLYQYTTYLEEIRDALFVNGTANCRGVAAQATFANLDPVART